MLNTDVELVFNIDVDSTGSGTQCILGFNCEAAGTKNLVATYARVRKLFVISYVDICGTI